MTLVTATPPQLSPLIECQLLRSSGSFHMPTLCSDPLLQFANAAREAGLPIHADYHKSTVPIRKLMVTAALLEVGAGPVLYCDERMDTMEYRYQWYAADETQPF